MRISSAGPAEAERMMLAFAGLYGQMIREAGLEGAGFIDDWQAVLARVYLGELRRGGMAAYLIEDGGRPIASAGVFLNDYKSNLIMRDLRATLAGVYVDPAYRRRGLARVLTERAIAWARKRGCHSIRLTTSIPAEQMYRSLGFTDGRELVLKL
jgi:GNAT superfamily N-acetyltransferase